MQPLVSFIVPVYNLPVALVEECLQSIMSLSLTEEEREVIVVDDGSAERFDDKLGNLLERISYFRTENQGLGPARNLGIAQAHGEYVQFVDGDDMLITNTYNNCLEQIRLYTPDIVMFGMTHEVGDESDDNMNVLFRELFDTYDSGTYFMTQNNLRGSACGYIFKRKMLGELRFNNIICEDEEFTPQLLLRANKLINTNIAAYFYRVREGSIINNTDQFRQERRFRDVLGVIVRLRNLSQTLSEDKKKALTRRVAQLTMDYIYNQWKFSGKISVVKETLQQLREKGLYPLPSECYTLKYTIFRLLLKLL